MNSGRAVRNRRWGARSRTAVQALSGLFAVLLLSLPAFSQGSFGRILGREIAANLGHEIASSELAPFDDAVSASGL